MSDCEARWTAESRFCHRALLYGGQQGFLDGSLPFIYAGLETREPTLVMAAAEKIDILRQALDGDRHAVLFADIAEIGHNPARIIPAWRQFVDDHADRGASLRGIGEQMWTGRSAAELVERQRYESLINIAFADTRSFELLCPYDTEAVAPEVIEAVGRSHPCLVQDARETDSDSFPGLRAIAAPFDSALSEPPVGAPELRFARLTLFELRAFIRRRGSDTGLGGDALEDFVTAVNEVATNSVLYGGGAGTVKLWPEDDALVCEVRDSGQFDQPLAGHSCPAAHELDGRGLWLANRLCDLIQIRSFPDGTVTRAHAHLPD